MGSRAFSVVAGLLAGAGVTAALVLSLDASGHPDGAPTLVVSQKGRAFSPNAITVKRGATVTIVNDDGQLRHHAYVDASSFIFDSGDQEPGSRTNIEFPLAGTFDVLCAIHPKMRLTVHVK